VNGTHCVVIDTNVLAVAEGMHDGASDECLEACVSLARRVLDGQRVAVDTAGEVIAEYVGTLGLAHRPGVGTKLAVRLHHQKYDDRICHLVEIATLEDPPGSYADVPTALRDFDTDDQKFLAVALASGCAPPVFAALDGEWWSRRADFAANGIDVQFRCVVDNL
jgi:predicted nucleic acid-binding protein